MILRLVLAVITGVLFALSFPNVAQGWLMFVALAPLLVAVARARSNGQAFLLGWIAFTTAWLIMVPWVVRVMSHYGGLPYITGVLIFVAMAVILGLYGGAFTTIVKRLRLGERFAPWLLIPLAWAAIEYARTFLLTGFPWNLVATAIVDYTPMIQIDRAIGPYFTGALVLLPSVVIAWAVTQRVPPISRVIVIGALGILVLVWWGTGLVASKLIVRPTGAATVRAALLQPNISQEMRWDEENVLAIYRKMIGMTVDAARNGAKVVIWPESTVPLSYTETAFYRESIEQLSREHGVDIILGSGAAEQPVELRVPRQQRPDHRPLRQDPPRAVRRVRAAAARAVLRREARARRGRVRVRHERVPPRRQEQIRPGHLLRDRLPADHPLPDPQRGRRARDDHQRRVVRRHVRPCTTPVAGPPARGRGQPLPPARRDHRYLRVHRSYRPPPGDHPHGPRRHHLRELRAADGSDAVRAVRGLVCVGGVCRGTHRIVLCAMTFPRRLTT
jgi:hypothetical protein